MRPLSPPCKLRYDDSKDKAAVKAELEKMSAMVAELKKKMKKGEMTLRKGATAFQIPDQGDFRDTLLGGVHKV